MNKQQLPRDVSPRDFEGSSALPQERGRSSAPRLSIWAPLAAKAVLAVVAAVVLAFIGARAGAHPSPPDEAPTPAQLSASAVALLAPPPQPPPVALADAGNLPADNPVSGRLASGGLTDGVLADGRIVLNVATEEDLVKLPGIGPSRARAILALRQRLAKFRAVEDLLRVKGIGRKTLRRIKPNVVLDRPVASDGAKQVLRD